MNPSKLLHGRAATTINDPRWPRVLARDASADGQFVYSVKTTGVYCRPSCGARPARPENVAFHLTRADAEAAGFRPCKRCKPDQPPLAEQHAELIATLCRRIEQAETAPTLDQLADAAGISRFHLHRVFKAVTGLTPRAYAAAYRAKRMRSELNRAGRVTDAIYDAGYGSNGRFYAEADGLLGMTPSAFRAGGRDVEIRFAIGQCTLGAILVAASARGICAILLGDDPDVLARDLQDRFPKATLIGADAGFEATVAQVVGLVEAPQLGHALPLDVRGTAFQQRVWQALRAIPAGETASYSEVAQRIGAPTSMRAVAQACGANALAVAIPCHRVVRSDGALSGYRWGVERKRSLLEREAKA
jgi:AraC family transcriptional regulator, regulatory protein of adaptative response / methylated-DNA-[protein]-cysteine methyltransferase